MARSVLGGSVMDATRAITTCAADLKVGQGAVTDTNAIRARFAEVNQRFAANLAAGMSRSEAIINAPAMIPDQVATVGGKDAARRSEVLKMVGCVGERAGLSAGMTQELQGMYKDATNAKSGNVLAWLMGR